MTKKTQGKQNNNSNLVYLIGLAGIAGLLYSLNKNSSKINENEVSLTFQSPITATQGQNILRFNLTSAAASVITSNRYSNTGGSLQGLTDANIQTLLAAPTIQSYLNSIKPVFSLKDISDGATDDNIFHLTLQNIQIKGVNIEITLSESIPFGLNNNNSYLSINFTGNEVNDLIGLIETANPALVAAGTILGDIKSAMDPKV